MLGCKRITEVYTYIKSEIFATNDHIQLAIAYYKLLWTSCILLEKKGGPNILYSRGTHLHPILMTSFVFDSSHTTSGPITIIFCFPCNIFPLSIVHIFGIFKQNKALFCHVGSFLRHDINEILLKVALNTITLTLKLIFASRNGKTRY